MALNNLQWLICHKTKPNQTKPKLNFLWLISTFSAVSENYIFHSTLFLFWTSLEQNDKKISLSLSLSLSLTHTHTHTHTYTYIYIKKRVYFLVFHFISPFSILFYPVAITMSASFVIFLHCLFSLIIASTFATNFISPPHKPPSVIISFRFSTLLFLSRLFLEISIANFNILRSVLSREKR